MKAITWVFLFIIGIISVVLGNLIFWTMAAMWPELRNATTQKAEANPNNLC
jgi:hypothetical protein